MATNTAQITIRKDTASNWTSSNPTPASGEFCLDTTNRKVRLGNGSTAHDSLPVTPDLFTKNGTDVASASTIDLDAATGDCVDVTGTTTITAITLAAGRTRIVRFTGALTLTNGASLVLPGGANITTVAGDVAVFRGYASSVVRCVQYSPLTRTGTGAIVHANTPTLTTPVLGVATGTSLAVTGAITSSSASAKIGYLGGSGAGSTVSQASSRTTGVTINAVCGQITLVSAAGSTSYSTFTVTNSAVAATDAVIAWQQAGTDLYHVNVTNVGSGSFKLSLATTGGTTTEQPVISFLVLKGVTS